jgi:hypothetical protein
VPASLPAVGKWTPAPDQAGRGAAGLGHHPPGGIAGVLEEGFQGVHLAFQVPVSPLRLAVPQPGPMPIRPARAHTDRCYAGRRGLTSSREVRGPSLISSWPRSRRWPPPRNAATSM